MPAPRLFPLNADVRRRLSGKPRILLLDIDGTLAPIAPTPDAARVPGETLKLLAALAARPDTRVALVTGRAAADGRRMISGVPLWIIGNHGAEVLDPEGRHEVEPSVGAYEPKMVEAARRIDREIGGIEGALVENKRLSLSVHYRLVDSAAVPRIRQTVESAAAELGLRLTEGKMVCEVKPPVRVHKGTAVLALLQRLIASWPAAGSADRLVLFAGDDVTDEDALRMLRAEYPRAVTVKIAADAGQKTAAEFSVADPDEMRAVLAHLAGTTISASSSPPA